jgi:ADP-ribose pyrophosphatase YjhB (NUDIX family)
MPVRPWQLISSEQVFDAGLFRVQRDRARSPRTGQEMGFSLVQMVDWLLVVALTVDGALVLVRQYRHGTRSTSLELPGGLHDDKTRTPQQGAARELAEETGFGDGEFSLLGVLSPQPAMLANRMHVYLARNVRRIAEPQPDAGEDIEVVLVDCQSIAATITGGDITNAMSLAALALARFRGCL